MFPSVPTVRPWLYSWLPVSMMESMASPVGTVDHRGCAAFRRKSSGMEVVYGGAGHAVFRDNAGDQVGVGHIKSRIEGFDPIGGHGLCIPHVGDFGSIALLDGDFRPGGGVQVNGGGGGRRCKRGCQSVWPERPRPTCRFCWRRRRWRPPGRSPQRPPESSPRFMTVAAMLSQMRVTSTPAAESSEAVSRAPCNRGRVSSAKTRKWYPRCCPR